MSRLKNIVFKVSRTGGQISGIDARHSTTWNNNLGGV